MHRHHHHRHRGGPLWPGVRASFVVILLLLTVAPAAAQEATPGATPVASPGATPLPDVPVGSPVPGASATPVLAYYSIRYNVDSWDRAKADFPALGRYPSDDPEIMRQHIQWAKAAGIDGFIVGWKNTEELTDRLRTLVQISEEEEFKLVLLYEGLNADRNPVPAPRIASDLEYFYKELGDSRALALFSRPVVIWSGSWEFSREEIELVTPQLRERLLILASERNPDDYRDRADLFDGDAYYWSSANPKTYARYSDKLKSMARAVHEHGGLWIAPAAPGFDARLIGGDRAVSRDDGDMLRTQLGAAFQADPDAIGLISWNEFNENSHVEPSCVYGVTSLEVLASMLGGTAPASVP
ncbi:MAG TPA: hypothetical protein VM450_17910, partial [Thermomicrobiales bacterium]|nr:hypothetical protein [Thermomicrobiales bacterium]